MFNGIVFTGASGTGKSTLAKWAARKYGLRELPSATKAAYEESGTSYGDAFRDPTILAQIQLDVFRKTAGNLRNAVFSGHPWVSERGPDVLIYSSLMCHDALPFPDTIGDIDTVCKRTDVLTVYVRPCPAIIADARARDDGRRNRFLSDEWVYRVDGAIAYHLERFDIPHVTLSSPDWPDRITTVERAVSELIWGNRPAAADEVATPGTKTVFTVTVSGGEQKKGKGKKKRK